jgi:hypothetical protein
LPRSMRSAKSSSHVVGDIQGAASQIKSSLFPLAARASACSFRPSRPFALALPQYIGLLRENGQFVDANAKEDEGEDREKRHK